VKWWVEGDPSQGGTGYGSVDAALADIRYRNTNGKRVVIEVSGTLTATSGTNMVTVSGGGYPHIVLQGNPANPGVLDANAPTGGNTLRRVLFINGNTVTLADKLTLKNGKANDLRSAKDARGGGVYLIDSTFNMIGGKIESCEARGGAAIFADDDQSKSGRRPSSSINISGGEITGCWTFPDKNATGGTVYVDYNTELTLSGTAKIHGNGKNPSQTVTTPRGGGVYIQGHGKLTMTGGEISGNSATTDGGGVYKAAPFSIFTQPGGTITGNSPNDRN
jgi:hypothetical protein